MQKWVLFIDFKGFAFGDNNPITGQRVISLLQVHYPERLGMVIIYDAPWLFSAMYKALRVVMDERTRQKIRFISHGDRSAEAWEFATPELRSWLQVPDARCPHAKPIAQARLSSQIRCLFLRCSDRATDGMTVCTFEHAG